jgi:hypothetical protein
MHLFRMSVSCFGSNDLKLSNLKSQGQGQLLTPALQGSVESENVCVGLNSTSGKHPVFGYSGMKSKQAEGPS